MTDTHGAGTQMSFTGKIQVIDPDSVVLEITMRAPVGQWKTVAASMQSKWPDWLFAAVIRQGIEKTVNRVESLQEVERT